MLPQLITDAVCSGPVLSYPGIFSKTDVVGDLFVSDATLNDLCPSSDDDALLPIPMPPDPLRIEKFHTVLREVSPHLIRSGEVLCSPVPFPL